jgi:hypothetical protein
MTDIIKFLAANDAGFGAFGPVIQSVMGVVSETAGLACNVARFGVALMIEPAPRKPAARPAPLAATANVIPFPARRNNHIVNRDG